MVAEENVLRPDADGEVPGGLSVDWPGKPKQYMPSRMRRARRWVVRAVLLAGFVGLMVGLTLAVTGTLDLNQFSWFRAWCVGSLGTERLAFLGSDGHYSDVYITDRHATRLCRLSYHSNAAGTIAWRNDGQQIVFALNSEGPPTLPMQGHLEPRASLGIAALTLDGQMHVLIPSRPTNSTVSSSTATSGPKPATPASITSLNETETLTTSLPARDTLSPLAPAWSPDGASLAFLQGSSPATLWVMSRDGLLPRTAAQDVVSFSWLPDSSTISYLTGLIPPRQQEIHLVQVDGTNDRSLSLPPGGNLKWSPDGKHIAWVLQSLELAIADADGSNMHMFRATRDMAWSPDSTRLTYSDEQSGTIHIVNADGSNDRVVHDQIVNVSDIAWSPDGAALAFAVATYSSTQVVILDLTTGQICLASPKLLWSGVPAWEPFYLRI